MLSETIERVVLATGRLKAIEGNLCFDPAVFDLFRQAPYDILPTFEGPAGSKLRGGRGKDHPRYGRFVYAFAKHYRPDCIVEVGTYAGGTSIGWGRALTENAKGRLVCVDNDTYSKNTYPSVTRRNIEKVGLPANRLQLLNGDSHQLVSQLARDLRGQVDIYLVDGDHTYEGALADMENGLPMLKPGGFMLVHDVDPGRRMDEMTPEHPTPVLEAFQKVARDHRLPWCILKFIRKHLGVIHIPRV